MPRGAVVPRERVCLSRGKPKDSGIDEPGPSRRLCGQGSSARVAVGLEVAAGYPQLRM